MGSDDELPRRSLVTCRRSHSVEDEETVPDSEDSTSPGETRPPDDEDSNPLGQPILVDRSDPPCPPRAVYRSRKRAVSPPSLSYTSVAPAEEVIPDSEDNTRSLGTSDDDDNSKKSPCKSTSTGLSDWKQKLQDIDNEYDTDEDTQSPHNISSALSVPKGASLKDPFSNPSATQASSQHASHRPRADESLSSPLHNVSSSTNTTPQFVFGTPQAPSPTPPTSDGKPSPIPKTTARTKGKGKARAPPEAEEATMDDPLVSSSPDGLRQTRRREKPKKSKAPTKKELLEARRETARMRSDMRASISTDATRPLDIKTLLKRFDVNQQPAPSARPLQPQSSVSEIEAWSSPSAHDLGPSGARQDEDGETSQQRHQRSTSPFRSNGLLAPPTKYRAASAVVDDDPFRITAPASAPKEPDADSGSGSDVEMPGIGDILAEKQARESLRTQREHLQKLKLAALAQQKKASAGADVPADAEEDSDDGLDVVADTMHSVAREEAAARALRSRPSAGRATQLRLARVAASPQRAPTLRLPTASPEKRMAAAAQSTFLASSFAQGKGNGAAGGRGKRSAGMTKAELQRMVLRSAEAQSEQLRREKEEEWVRRGGRVVGVMEVVGDEKVQELIGEALERDEGARAQDDGDDSDDGDDDGEYVPIERGRGSVSPRPIEAQELGDDGEEETPADAKVVLADERPGDDNATAEEADSEVESHAPDEQRLRGPRAARARRAVIGSDDEDGQSAAENTGADERDAHPPPLSLPDLPSPAFTSIASPWPSAEPDHDHENDPDVSGNDTDKENRAVAARPTPAHGARVLFDDLLGAGLGPKAAVQALPLLQPSVFALDDDPFAFTPSPAKAREDALRRLESPTPLRVFDTAGTGKRGLSQMFEEEANGDNANALTIQGAGDNDPATQGGLVGLKPALGGLSEAFEQTQDASGSGSGAGGLGALRRAADAELSLTLEAQAVGLQPALEVDDRLRARAAAIFEKEQEYVIQAAQPTASSRPRRELYITENGFLTQNRPEGSSPLLYRPSPSQPQYDALLRTQSEGALGGAQASASRPLVTRQPLSTLAETSPVSSSPMGKEPLRRLRRAHTTPDDRASESSAQRYAYLRGQSLSPSPSPSPARAKGAAVMPRTAFTKLLVGAQRDKVKAKTKKRSEFVEDQAAESDEDDMLGFGGARKKPDEDDEEDEEHDVDGVVKSLVDDAHMDESALARPKVLEKHLELQNADDERVEKEVQDVVAGKKRKTRRGGAGGLLGSDESDESEDEDARALRQRLAKKRRVDGDTLDALARDPTTASFHATYQMALVDDAEEFAHLDRDQDLNPDPDPDQGQDDQDQDQGEGGEGDGREEGNEDGDGDVEMAGPSKAAGQKEISAAEVRKALQEVARGEREYHALDPEDVSWMDQDLDMDEGDAAGTLHARVRIASSAPKAPHRPQPLPADADMDVLSLHRVRAEDQHDSAYAQRMKRWAREEGATGRGGSGRSTGTGVGAGAGAAVTGHRPRAANKKSSSSTATANAKARQIPAAAAPSAVRKTASVLSAVADRRGRFGT